MQRWLFRIAIVAVAFSTVTGVARGGEPREHEGGFFLRLSGGIGFANTSIDDGIDEVTFKGPAGDGDLAIGVVLSPNLAIHGTIFGWSMVEPDLEISGVTFETDDLTVSLGAVGGGVTYYVGESNLYLTGSLGVASLTAEFDGESADTDLGFAVEAGLGKEWWVGDSWGLGVSGMFTYHSVTADEDFGNEKLAGPGFGVRFSATYN